MTQPIHQTNASGRRSAVRKTAFLLMTLVMTAVSAQQKPTTGYAPVYGINMYYEVHGRRSVEKLQELLVPVSRSSTPEPTS
jgi:hypothetical protein